MYKRVLLKISGEALGGAGGVGIDPAMVEHVVNQIIEIHDRGVEVAVVMGGGNFWRGRQGINMERVTADQMGMLMQPELSHWDPVHAFEAPESFAYYQTELKQVILTLANHPSFVMLTFGNELAAGPVGHARMDSMLALAHELDPTRLYANSSNAHYGDRGIDPESDFFASQKYFGHDLRGIHAGGGEDGALQGYINNRYPDAAQNYDASMAEIRKVYQKPIFSFEVGQFEVLPDFHELESFRTFMSWSPSAGSPTPPTCGWCRNG